MRDAGSRRGDRRTDFGDRRGRWNAEARNCRTCVNAAKRQRRRGCVVIYDRATNFGAIPANIRQPRDSDDQRVRRIDLLKQFDLFDLIDTEELEKALPLDRYKWGKYFREAKEKLTGPRCSRCDILKSAVKNKEMTCWMSSCPMRGREVSATDLDRYAGLFCRLVSLGNKVSPLGNLCTSVSVLV
jgi:hypothetical protein